jgi:hypothetical protein
MKQVKNSQVMHSLDFEITDEQSLFYAAIFDYSGLNGLGLAIIKADDQHFIEEDFEILSEPSKYFKYISPVTLTRGSYSLLI